MSQAKSVTAGVLVIGEEILSGRIQDANVQFLAQELTKIGVRLIECRVVRDDVDIIAEAVTALRERCDYVFTTGGIGPTHDDVTTEGVAKAFGVKVVRFPEAVKALEAWYKTTDINAARLRMAEGPEGAEPISNAVSAAPGWKIDNVFVLAGIPQVCRAMFDALKPGLIGGPPMLSWALRTELAEGKIAADLGAIQKRYPGVEIGSYPYARGGIYGTTLVARSPEPEALAEVAAAIIAMARAHGDDPRVEST